MSRWCKMVQWCGWLFRRWAIWCERRIDDPLIARTKTLVTAWDSVEASGEYKRHGVYAQLLKEFPDVSRRRVAYLIELVLTHDT